MTKQGSGFGMRMLMAQALCAQSLAFRKETGILARLCHLPMPNSCTDFLPCFLTVFCYDPLLQLSSIGASDLITYKRN